MSETAQRAFEFEGDAAVVANFAEQMFGDRLDPDGEERWKVVVNPPELDLARGTVIVTDDQYFVLDREPTEERITFRVLYVIKSLVSSK